MTLFALKKAISALLLPPGGIAVFLFAVGLPLARRKHRLAAALAVAVAALLWLTAIAPVADRLAAGLERGLTMPRPLSGDAIILLGGGAVEGAQDLTGSGGPTDETMSRIVMAVRAQRALHVPIIVAGGQVFANRTPEAYPVKRVLCDLGVPQTMVIVEDKSRDTGENALFAGQICARRGFRKVLLVTSAYHMRRALAAFSGQRVQVVALPANLLPRQQRKYIWIDFLPSFSEQYRSCAALHEYLGLLFYRLGR